MKLTEEMKRFPYPFKGDTYRYTNNSTLLTPPSSIDITEGYLKEIQLKRALLTEHHSRSFQSFPYTNKAQWEVLELVMTDLSTYFPKSFSFKKEGQNHVFINHLLQEECEFKMWDETTLPFEPLDFIGRHVQEDLILMLQRDGDLYLDAGQLCFPANWSLAFNHGMSFKNIHFPIPGFKEEGLDERILQFLLRLEAGNPWGRKNWSLMAGNRMDTSLETFDVWGKDRKKVTVDNAGEFVHLRVEVQKLFRLPRTNAILFTIHTHLLPLEELIEIPEWKRQFYQILVELPSHIAEYKGISLYKDKVLAYIEKKEDGVL
ncbi:hypothetical protein B4U37_20970 [Sutcliffiella horikoshii]|uniref:DUF3445 domain-containing protein n=1 Tax=Sutcliffiella horikoshii TaxID=79883 RepID=A0A1Y0CSN0_9BACI|nr:DUF3445 domain-containing protein [Sutcliffiella horikoshii]ART78370.1 hypothetical protein B4U37_20970 [Sutcliffiella horikoshii]TYS59697.1 DUF3445 domain-containing protein [Sutcliffiella horikoshii]